MLNLKIAVGELSNGKSPRVDELMAEKIKATGGVGMQWLYRVMQVIWKENKELMIGEWLFIIRK